MNLLNEINGTTALFFLNFLIIFLSNFIEKFGLAASCIKHFLVYIFFRYFKAIKDESDLSLPPLMILIFLNIFFFKIFILLVTTNNFFKKL